MTQGLQGDLFAFYLQKAEIIYNVQGIVLFALQAKHIESYHFCSKWKHLGQIYFIWNLSFYHNEGEKTVNGFDSFFRVKLM